MKKPNKGYPRWNDRFNQKVRFGLTLSEVTVLVSLSVLAFVTSLKLSTRYHTEEEVEAAIGLTSSALFTLFFAISGVTSVLSFRANGWMERGRHIPPITLFSIGLVFSVLALAFQSNRVRKGYDDDA